MLWLNWRCSWCADVALFRVFVFRIHHYHHNHTESHPSRIIHHDLTTWRRRRRRWAWMLLLGSIGDGSLYVSFHIARGTWRFACVGDARCCGWIGDARDVLTLLFFVCLSFESTTTTTTPNPTPNESCITTSPRNDKYDDAGHGCYFLARSAMAERTYHST